MAFSHWNNCRSQLLCNISVSTICRSLFLRNTFSLACWTEKFYKNWELGDLNPECLVRSAGATSELYCQPAWRHYAVSSSQVDQFTKRRTSNLHLWSLDFERGLTSTNRMEYKWILLGDLVLASNCRMKIVYLTNAQCSSHCKHKIKIWKLFFANFMIIKLVLHPIAKHSVLM